MDLYLRITLTTALIIYFLFIFILLKKGKLELKYTLLWLLAGIIMVCIVVFPNEFIFLMQKMGIIEGVNGVFATVIFLIIMILMSMTSIVSIQNANFRQLVQKCALYEKRIRELEMKVNNHESSKSEL